MPKFWNMTASTKCIRAIKRGEAGCTLVEALRAVRLLGEDKSLEMLPLTDTCGFCFGVSYGDTGLLRVLSHGLSILGDDYGISHAYQYVGDITSYNMRDFMRTHMWVVYLLAAVLAVWLLCIFIVRYRMLKRISEAEAKHNHALQQALMKAQQANYARQLFLNNLSHDIPHAAQRHSRSRRNQPENRRPGNPPRKPVQDTGRGGTSARHLE